jgi:thiol-disulfide isomerase/thioredoxin
LLIKLSSRNLTETSTCPDSNGVAGLLFGWIAYPGKGIRHLIVEGVRFFCFAFKKGCLRLNSLTLRIFRLPRAAVVVAAVLLLIGIRAYGQNILELHSSAADLIASNRGRVLVLLFVRTDCPISNRYAPLIQQMSTKYGRVASFQLVFPDRNQSPEKIKEFLNDYHYQLPAIRDVDHVLTKKTLVKVTPEAAVFDVKGALVYHGRIDNLYEHIGQARRAATTHELSDAIDAAIKGAKVQRPAADGVGCFISDLE